MGGGDVDKRHPAKRAATVDFSLLKTEAKTVIKRNIIKEWQHSWDTGSTGRHIYSPQQLGGGGEHFNGIERGPYTIE